MAIIAATPESTMVSMSDWTAASRAAKVVGGVDFCVSVLFEHPASRAVVADATTAAVNAWTGLNFDDVFGIARTSLHWVRLKVNGIRDSAFISIAWQS
ncbi:MAG TPA: hypothetical protein VFL67_06570 [Mycobacterium sp.]|nr:hypothetical protein [Mycobacterium sp.]